VESWQSKHPNRQPNPAWWNAPSIPQPICRARITEVSAALGAAVDRLSQAIATARQQESRFDHQRHYPGSSSASLFVAFLFGVAIARRR